MLSQIFPTEINITFKRRSIKNYIRGRQKNRLFPLIDFVVNLRLRGWRPEGFVSQTLLFVVLRGP